MHRGRQWTGEYVVNFQDLIASNISEEVEYAEEARFSFIKGAYMEDSHPQGIHFVFSLSSCLHV